MSRRAAAALLLAWAVPAAALEAVPVDKSVAEAVDLYRSGRLPEALLGMADVLERDPGNATAKTYVWTIARRMRERERSEAMTSAEREAAFRRAGEILEERRRRSRDALAKLRDAYESTRDVRGPEDLARGAAGMERYLDAEFESENARVQAEAYFHSIMENLSKALKSSAFVARKDHLRAEATLAYYKGQWEQALSKWELALKEDPADASLRADVEHLKEAIGRREREARVRELAAQAETYQRTGFMEEAARAWKQVQALAPDDKQAAENAALCRRAHEREVTARRVRELTAQGVALYQQGRTADAVDSWLKALELDPGHDQARVWISHAGRRMDAGRGPAPVPSPADAEAKPAAVAAAPTTRDAAKARELYREGLLLYAGNEVSRAIALWKEALRLEPGLVAAQQALRQAVAEVKYID